MYMNVTNILMSSGLQECENTRVLECKSNLNIGVQEYKSTIVL